MGSIMWYPAPRRERLRDAAERIRLALETTRPETDKVVQTPAGIEDLTGRVIGQLTVIGLYMIKCPARMNVWLVQCQCGQHEVRRQRWLKNPIDTHKACCRGCRTPK